MGQSEKYVEEKVIIKQIYDENKEHYGYRRITLELCNRGYHLTHKTV
jgi:putative transposase